VLSSAIIQRSLADLRLGMDAEVTAGDQHTSNHAAPDLWVRMDRIGRECRPAPLRGDASFRT
jgi:hypothetical protein